MSTTGIVRRIDDLGRVVIPKEIRKTLRIKDGEALEIEVVNDNIILKKYSSLGDIQGFLDILIQIVNKIIHKSIFIFDTDRIISESGYGKERCVNYNISDYIYHLMSERKVDFSSSDVDVEIIKGQILHGHYLFSSIIPNGDVVGGILIFSEEEEINEQDQMFLKLIVETLTKYVEE